MKSSIAGISCRPLCLPTLTETPSERSIFFGIVISAIASVLVTTLYLVDGAYYMGVFFGLILFVMAGHAVLSYYWFRGNILIFIRYLLLFIPIFVTTLAWWIWEGGVLTGPFGTQYQTVDSTSLLVTAGFLSLMGCTTGWLAAFYGYSGNLANLRAAIERERKLVNC